MKHHRLVTASGRRGTPLSFPGLVFLAGIVLAGLPSSRGATITVKKDGSGDFTHINAAAQAAQPGDTVLVHQGVYREWVRPPRGGTPEKPIVYRAAPGEQVRITGAAEINGWTLVENGVHTVTLPADYFGKRNPFATKVAGPYMTYGKWHHLGQVYLNNTAFIEVESPDKVAMTPRSWYAEVRQSKTNIRANFGTDDPNAGLTEINRRALVFSPETAGCSYIVIDGFTISQAATAWAPPNRKQEGAVWPNMARNWIIRNCVIEHSRCTGVSIGLDPKWPEMTKANIGHHEIRNCIIRNCGEAGVVGNRASSFSLIEGNLIEDINTSEEFGGWETAGIKVHLCVDLIIRGNCIRRVHWGAQEQKLWCRESGFGIWIDFACQNVRITRNVILECEGECIDYEKNYGPMLVDNNVLIGSGALIVNGNEASVWVHNLFCGGSLKWHKNDKREPFYWKPHTLEKVKWGRPGDTHHKVFNNIFINAENQLPKGNGNAADYNIYIRKSRKSRFDAHSIAAPAFDADFSYTSDADGVTLKFNMVDAVSKLHCPLIKTKTFGIFFPAGQGIENPDGSPLTVDKDFRGQPRKSINPTPGPFENLSGGRRQFSLFKCQDIPGTDAGGPPAPRPAAPAN